MRKVLGWILGTSLILVAYQNCGEGFQTKYSDDTNLDSTQNTQLGILLTGPTATASREDCSTAFTATLSKALEFDSVGQLLNHSGQVYSDADCTQALENLVIPAGSTEYTFFLKHELLAHKNLAFVIQGAQSNDHQHVFYKKSLMSNGNASADTMQLQSGNVAYTVSRRLIGAGVLNPDLYAETSAIPLPANLVLDAPVQSSGARMLLHMNSKGVFSPGAEDFLQQGQATAVFGVRNGFVCSLMNNAIKCWNRDVEGDVLGLPAGDITAVASGNVTIPNSVACAVVDGATYCWTSDNYTATLIPGLEAGVTDIAVSTDSAIWAVKDGQLYSQRLLTQTPIALHPLAQNPKFVYNSNFQSTGVIYKDQLGDSFVIPTIGSTDVAPLPIVTDVEFDEAMYFGIPGMGCGRSGENLYCFGTAEGLIAKPIPLAPLLR